MTRFGPSWSDEEIATLRECVRDGLDYRQTGAKIPTRSLDAVRAIARALNLKFGVMRRGPHRHNWSKRELKIVSDYVRHNGSLEEHAYSGLVPHRSPEEIYARIRRAILMREQVGNKGKWSKEELAIVSNYVSQGGTDQGTGYYTLVPGRSHVEIYAKIRRMMNRRTPTNVAKTAAREQIPCITCRMPFFTKDRKKNRMCDSCRKSANGGGGFDDSHSYSHFGDD